ncbi:MAG: putative membrane protein YfcA [Hyphomicrobiaceae bacterium]|jgi:uncharacterized membrane protein YfcA
MTVLGLAMSLLIGVSLGLFGGGGSILTVPLLVYVFGLDAKTAIASSLLIVGIASASGALQHWWAGNLRIKTGLVFGTSGMVGAYFGGRAGAFLDGPLLLLLFSATMVLTAAAMWRGRSTPTPSATYERNNRRLLQQGLAVGSFTGLVGAGGGFLIVPALALWAGLPMRAAVGTSLFIIVLNTGAGFSGYASHVAVDYPLIGKIAIAAIIGSFAGSRLSDHVDPNSLRRGFAGFVGVMAAFIFVREADAWARIAKDALPDSVPQMAFALVMLAIGVFAGRTTQSGPQQTSASPVFSNGGGI